MFEWRNTNFVKWTFYAYKGEQNNKDKVKYHLTVYLINSIS